MSKMKRLFVVLLTLAMVLGMSVMTFADVTGITITVTGVDTDSTVSYEQIIVPDQGEPTGWKFVSDSTAAASFKAAIKNAADNSEKTDQQIIAGLIKCNDAANGEKLPKDLKDSAATVNTDLLRTAFNIAVLSKTATPNGENFEFPANSAGVYVIHATDVAKTVNSKVTEWITYNPMAAYVSFGYTNGVVTSLEAEPVTAKKNNYSLTKEDNEEDKVTAVGDVVEYTIKTSVPYIPDEVTQDNVEFKIVDSIKGAQYVDSSVNTGAAPAGVTPAVDEVKVMVKLQNESEAREMNAEIKAVSADSKYESSFELDLSEIAKVVDTTTGRRTNANQALEITYKAYVTGTEIENNAYMNTKTSNDGAVVKGPEDDDKIYTGALQITKKNADSKDDADKTLANAKFVLYYKLNGTTYYAVTEKTGDAYTVTGWTETKPSEDDNLLITGEDGTAMVKGLEDDTDRDYLFEEVEAPEGYSINKTPAGITSWEDGKRNEAASADKRVGYSEISDTQLSSLPSTGGIGTTIFTIAGCLIMIAAAGLFFASRRKSEK